MKSIAILILSLLPSLAFPQTDEARADTTRQASNQEPVVSISLNDLTEIKEAAEKAKELRTHVDTLKTVIRRLSEDKKKLEAGTAALEDSLRTYKNDLNESRDQLLKKDKRLQNIAAYFLVIPYSDLSVKKIAIPAFGAITDTLLKKRRQGQYELLKNYRSHVSELRDTLINIQKNLDSDFVKDNAIQEERNRLKQTRVYKAYESYGYLDTEFFLAQMMVSTLRKLKAKVNLQPEIDTLTQCLETDKDL